MTTPEGSDLAEPVLPRHLSGVNDHFSTHLDEEDLGSIRRTLSKVLKGEGP